MCEYISIYINRLYSYLCTNSAFLALLYDVIMALVAHFLSILIMMMFHKELDQKEILPSGKTSQWWYLIPLCRHLLFFVPLYQYFAMPQQAEITYQIIFFRRISFIFVWVHCSNICRDPFPCAGEGTTKLFLPKPVCNIFLDELSFKGIIWMLFEYFYVSVLYLDHGL